MSKIVDLNIHIYPSYLTNESRILRESRSLIDLSLVKRIEIVGYWKEGLLKEDNISPGIKFIRVKTLLRKKAGSLKFLNLLSFPIFYLAIILRCFREKPEVVNCHTLTVLPLGFLLKLFFRVKLIYDPHELETETNDSKGIRKSIAKTIEKLFINSADSVIVVGAMIAQWYRDKYKLTNIHVVKNIPSSKVAGTENNELKLQLGLSDGDLLFIYVGALESGRGVELLLDVFSALPKDCHLVFLGYGSLKQKIVETKSTTSNIHLVDAVHPDKVIQVVSGANVGICLIENSCLSYYYCLPNKSFEYLRAGIPFISSDFPELRMEFEKANVCWFAELNKENLKNMLVGMSKKSIEEKRFCVLKERDNWTWEEEGKKYLKIYNYLN